MLHPMPFITDGDSTTCQDFSMGTYVFMSIEHFSEVTIDVYGSNFACNSKNCKDDATKLQLSVGKKENGWSSRTHSPGSYMTTCSAISSAPSPHACSYFCKCHDSHACDTVIVMVLPSEGVMSVSICEFKLHCS